jgi:hypothetical protein
MVSGTPDMVAAVPPAATMRNHYIRIFGSLVLFIAVVFGLVSCSSEADTVSYNVSKDADNFKIDRRIVFFNGITDKYLLVIEGRCSLGNDDPKWQLSVVCKTGPTHYKKHFLGLSDNVSYFVEQTEESYANAYHYKVIFRPETIVPDIELRTSRTGDNDITTEKN